MEYKRKKVLTHYTQFLPQTNSVEDFIEALQKFPKDAEVEINTWEDSSGWEIYINHYRMETDEEVAQRKENETAWDNILRERRYENYLKLKLEFESELPKSEEVPPQA